MAAKFSGHFSEDDYAQVTWTTAHSGYPYTMSFWVYEKSTYEGSGESVVYSVKSDYYERWAIDNGFLDNNKENGFVGLHMQRTGSGGGTSYVPNHIQAVEYDKLQHICVLTTNGDDITVYVNGVIAEETEAPQWRNIFFNQGINYIIVGNSQTTSASHRYGGYVSEMAFYTSGLTADQIALLQTNRPDAIGVTPKHYWPLYNSFEDLGSDGDDLVYNVGSARAWGGADNYFEPDPTYHPSLVGSATLDTITETSVLIQGQTYTTGGAPYSNVPETHAAIIERNNWGTVTYDDDKGGTAVYVDNATTIDGEAFTAATSYFVDKQTAASLQLEGNGRITSGHPFSGNQFAQFQGEGYGSIQNTSVAITGFPFACGGWLKIMSDSNYNNHREWVQFFDSGANFRTAGKSRWDETFVSLDAANGANRNSNFGIENQAVSASHYSINPAPYNSWEKWVHVHFQWETQSDIRVYVNGVEDTGSSGNQNYFTVGNLTELYLGGKKISENGSKYGFAHWYLYNGTTPSASEIVELSKFYPNTVTTPPDNYWPLNGDTNDAIGSLNLIDNPSATETIYVWTTGGPKISEKY